MLIYKDNIKEVIQDIELEIEAIKHSFANTISAQRDSYKPFAVYFDSPEDKSTVMISRSVQNESDYYSAISEMLFAYSALQSHAVLLAVDARKQIDGKDQDLLEIYLANPDFCEVFSMPYEVDDNNNFVWLENLFNVFSLEKMEKTYDTSGYFFATLEIFEALYLHVHLHKQIFEYSKMRDYYLDNGYEISDYISDPDNFSTPVDFPLIKK